MNIVINKNEQALTTSRLVAHKFGKQHKDVLKAIKNLDSSDQFNERNFAPINFKDSRNRNQIEYTITKDGFTFLVMGFTGKEAAKFKEQYILAFNKMEDEIRNRGRLPTSFAEALRLAADTQEQLEATTKKLEANQRKLSIAAPKAAIADKIANTDSLVSMSEAVKLLKLPFGRNTFFRKLREAGVLFANKNEPKQSYVTQGYFELKSSIIQRSKGEVIVFTTYVTSKGLIWLGKKFGQVAQS